MNSPRIALIHATPLAVQPIADAFARHWRDAQLMNVLDDSLSRDLAAIGSITPAMTQRFVDLEQYAKGCGCVATLFTCSAFGSCIETAASATGLPTWKPNEAMFEEVLALAEQRRKEGKRCRVALVATFEPSLPSMRSELLELAAQRDLKIELETLYAPEAMADLAQGNASIHHAKILKTLVEHAGTAPEFIANKKSPWDAVMLAQFSMAAAQETVQARMTCPVLTSPDCAVLALKKKLQTRSFGIENMVV